MGKVEVSMGEDGTVFVELEKSVLLEIPTWITDSSNPNEAVLICEFHRRQKLTDEELYDLILYVLEDFFRQADQHLYWEFVDLDRECWARGPVGVPLLSWTSIEDAWPTGIETRPTQLKGAPRVSGLSEVGAVKGFRSFLTAITATPDGRFITAHGRGDVQVVDPKTGKKEKVAKLETPMGLGSVWMTQAGVVVAHSRNKVFALADGKLSELDFLGLACMPSPDGTRVAIGDDEGDVRICSLPDLKEIGRFQAAHGVPWQEEWSRSKSYWPCIWSLSFIGETQIVVSHTFPIISFWNIDTHERLNVMIDYEIPRPSIAQTGRMIAHAGPGLIRVISAEGDVCGEHRHAETTFRMSCAGLGRGGRVACTQYSGSTIRVWDAETGNLFAEVPCRKNEPFALSDSMLACVHPESRQLTFYELPIT